MDRTMLYLPGLSRIAQSSSQDELHDLAAHSSLCLGLPFNKLYFSAITIDDHLSPVESHPFCDTTPASLSKLEIPLEASSATEVTSRA